MPLKMNTPLVSVDWLKNHLDNKNIIILDCTIPKVTANKNDAASDVKERIKGALFFDIKNIFSDKSAEFPNTVLTPKEFEQKAQDLGINKDSAIVCYDDLGIYSAPRVWWNFKLMGFNNVAVLNGGLPKWKENKYPTEKPIHYNLEKGNFQVDYQPKKITYTKDVLAALENEKISIVDARSKGRFYATAPEPRNDVKRGHIPNSINLPFTEILENGMLKSEKELISIFKKIHKNKDEIIFTCGSGITASILALGATISGIENYAVYDGSWTEWGLTDNLPIAL